jgi:hypothetical protein
MDDVFRACPPTCIERLGSALIKLWECVVRFFRGELNLGNMAIRVRFIYLFSRGDSGCEICQQTRGFENYSNEYMRSHLRGSLGPEPSNLPERRVGVLIL